MRNKKVFIKAAAFLGSGVMAAAMLGGCSGNIPQQGEISSAGKNSEPQTIEETEAFSAEELPETYLSESVTEYAGALEYESAAELQTESLEEMETESVEGEADGTSTTAIPIRHLPWPDSAAELLSPAMNRFMLIPLTAPDSYMPALRNKLLQQLNSYDGNWSVYMKDLTTDEELIIGDQVMHSASTMKLFILGTVYRAFEEGTLERTSEMVDLMSAMICASSNTAANELITRLGGGDFAAGVDVVNRYISEEGYSSSTVLYNGFQEESLHIHPDNTNSTSARDVGLLLERVYRRTFNRRAVCNEVEEWMLKQNTRYKIPNGVPDGVLVGNKTGETDSIENDCAVIYTIQGDYILCVFSNDWEDKSLAQHRITDISSTVYRYFSGTASSEAVLHIPGDTAEAETESQEPESEGIILPLAETDITEADTVEEITEKVSETAQPTERETEEETSKSAETDTESAETAMTSESEIETVKSAETEPETVKSAETEPETVKSAETEPETVKSAETESETVKSAETEPETVKSAETEPETVKSAETEPETAESSEAEMGTDAAVEEEAETETSETESGETESVSEAFDIGAFEIEASDTETSTGDMEKVTEELSEDDSRDEEMRAALIGQIRRQLQGI